MKTREIKEFDGGYARHGKIWVEEAQCTICGKERVCIVTDASENEYRAAPVCAECVSIECEKGTS